MKPAAPAQQPPQPARGPGPAKNAQKTPKDEHTHALGVVIVAALVVADGLVGVTAADQVRAAQVLDRVFEVGLGVEQALGAAGVAHGAGGIVPDLHQPQIRAVAGPGVEAALLLDDTADQRFGDAVDGGIFDDQPVHVGDPALLRRGKGQRQIGGFGGGGPGLGPGLGGYGHRLRLARLERGKARHGTGAQQQRRGRKTGNAARRAPISKCRQHRPLIAAERRRRKSFGGGALAPGTCGGQSGRANGGKCGCSSASGGTPCCCFS